MSGHNPQFDIRDPEQTHEILTAQSRTIAAQQREITELRNAVAAPPAYQPLRPGAYRDILRELETEEQRIEKLENGDAKTWRLYTLQWCRERVDQYADR